MCDIAVEYGGTRNLAALPFTKKNPPEYCSHMATLNACFQKYLFDSKKES